MGNSPNITIFSPRTQSYFDSQARLDQSLDDYLQDGDRYFAKTGGLTPNRRQLLTAHWKDAQKPKAGSIESRLFRAIANYSKRHKSNRIVLTKSNRIIVRNKRGQFIRINQKLKELSKALRTKKK